MVEKDEELPVGFGFSLAMNQDAMKNFSNLSVEERKKVIEESRQAASKEQMSQLVDRLATNSFQG